MMLILAVIESCAEAKKGRQALRCAAVNQHPILYA